MKERVRPAGFPDPLRALVFDLDGTLADTERFYRRFWLEAAAEFGYPMELRHTLMIRAMDGAVAGPLLRREICPDFDFETVRGRRRQLMEEWVKVHGISPRPGAPETLRAAKEKGILLGLATSTPKSRAEEYISLLGMEGLFDAVVCGDMITRGKPEPDIYLTAQKLLGVAAEEAAAVEDAPTGLRAARASGLYAIFVPELDVPDEEAIEESNLVLPDLFALRDLLSA